MLRSKGIYTAAGALTCAIGIGFFMQSTDAADQQYGTASAVALPELPGAASGNEVLDVQEITLTSGAFETALVVPEDEVTVTPAAAPVDIEIDAEPRDPIVAPACDINAVARPVAAAMVDLTMEATCFPNERVTVHHNGMVFTEKTSETGALALTVPALSTDAVFIIAFANGEGAVAQTEVPDLGDFDRAVLQWKGDSGFQIHAREFGANYGSAGHLWAEAPGDLSSAVTGASGLLTRHGDIDAAEPLLAEVYSFPKVANARSGNIALSVEAEITAVNCGLEIEAQSLEMTGDGQIKTQNLTLPVPECDAMGSFLVLNNLLQDLTLAAK
ncbi:MAG: hypothetical protein AAF307_00960 [Pseudomonadota bacterium]